MSHPAKREETMEKMYEVMGFVDHGAYSRQTMDCVPGTVMAEFLRHRPEADKEMLFRWFRELCLCLDQYHRSGRQRRIYRYLNPYSIVVTRDKELRLLDLEAPGNSFVMKQMQRRSVRDHFVKPSDSTEIGCGCQPDLFAYGRMIQFLLSYMTVTPCLTRIEEMRFLKIVGRCTGEGKGRYECMDDVRRELPRPSERNRVTGGKRELTRKHFAAVSCACVVVCLVMAVVRNGIF